MTDTLAAVLTKEPDWTQLPANTLARACVLLQRCLQKMLVTDLSLDKEMLKAVIEKNGWSS